jgi:hypothetical protein
MTNPICRAGKGRNGGGSYLRSVGVDKLESNGDGDGSMKRVEKFHGKNEKPWRTRPRFPRFSCGSGYLVQISDEPECTAFA